MIMSYSADDIEDTVSAQGKTSFFASDEAVDTAEDETPAQLCKTSRRQGVEHQTMVYLK